LSSFWLILKQQWTIEEISIFSNSSHFEWRAGLSDTILKGNKPKDHPSQICFNLVQGFQRRRFKCESLRRTPDAKWWQKLTWPLARWAKKINTNNKKLLNSYICHSGCPNYQITAIVFSIFQLVEEGGGWFEVYSTWIIH
jgi:hypothetical protein